ncbi:MAG: succinate dehydrogenase assembly factor 2 [Methylomonas sp.]|jgi:antitoxin CptB
MNELNKLRWRCRRGTLELDLILLGYLENRFARAEKSEQQQFLRLLECEDDELIRYVIEGHAAPDANLNQLAHLLTHG